MTVCGDHGRTVAGESASETDSPSVFIHGHEITEDENLCIKEVYSVINNLMW